MANVNKVAVGIFVGLVVVIVAGFLLLSRPDKGEESPVEAVETALPTPLPDPTPTLAEQLSERLAGLTVSTSDTVVSELVTELSTHPQLAKWVVTDDLIRRFVASINNVAEGSSPSKHVEFLRPSTPFRAVEKTGSIFVNQSSFDRYGLFAEVFTSLDTEGTVTLYQELKPLIDEAYREISPPGWVFEDRLNRAIDQLLDVPIPVGDLELEERTIATYRYVDDRFESLNDAQRHLLRMGPENVQRIQEKLREFQNAIRAANRS